ncbi:hypothetical protein WAI453_001183 [Rhynchosporium graminicola]
MVDYSGILRSTHTVIGTTPSSELEADTYRMDRFLNEIQESWYTGGQGGGDLNHTTAMALIWMTCWQGLLKLSLDVNTLLA